MTNPTQSEPAPLVSVQEAARLLSSGLTRTWSLVGDGTLEARRFGRRTLIVRESLDRFIANLPPARGKAA